MKMRDKIKFQKLEEISLEEIQGGENGELNKVKCVLLMVIRIRPPKEQNKDAERLRKGPKSGPSQVLIFVLWKSGFNDHQ